MLRAYGIEKFHKNEPVLVLELPDATLGDRWNLKVCSKCQISDRKMIFSKDGNHRRHPGIARERYNRRNEIFERDRLVPSFHSKNERIGSFKFSDFKN